jgi:transposase
MGAPQPRTRAALLQARRLRAIQMIGIGASQADVARRLGVTREAVRQWVDAWREGGAAALAPRRHPPRHRVELARVAKALAWQVRSAQLLTTEQVHRLIVRVFGVAYSASSVRAILGQLGFSYSRKAGWQLARARQSARADGARHTRGQKGPSLRAN